MNIIVPCPTCGGTNFITPLGPNIITITCKFCTKEFVWNKDEKDQILMFPPIEDMTPEVQDESEESEIKWA